MLLRVYTMLFRLLGRRLTGFGVVKSTTRVRPVPVLVRLLLTLRRLKSRQRQRQRKVGKVSNVNNILQD